MSGYSVEELRSVTPEPLTLEQVKSRSPGFDSDDKSNSTAGLKKVIDYLLKIQKLSAYTLSGFIGIHVASVVVAPGIGTPFGPSQDIFEMARAIYHGIPYFEEIGIIGASLSHVLSGIGIRVVRSMLRRRRKGTRKKNKLAEEPVIKDDQRDDIGLGGITGLLGLGYRKSLVSQYFPTLSPLQFSGYLLMPLVAYHFCKFRYIPVMVDGDSSLVNLNYVTSYLKLSPQGEIGNAINFLAMFSLVVVGLYHFVSGLLKFNRKFSMKYKKMAYGAIATSSLLALVSMTRFRTMGLAEGFIGKRFGLYINYWRL